MALTSTKSTKPDLQKSVPHRVRELVVGLGVVGFHYDPALSVTVPSIGTAGLGGSVDVTVTGVALGDSVLAADPTAALPANCIMTGAHVVATNTVRFSYQAVGGTVTGASTNHTLVIADRT
jgi:hypothetical protein